MSVNTERIIKKLKGTAGEKGAVTLYMNKDLFNEFKKVCEKHDVVPSKVLEEMMKDFIADLKSK